MAAIELTLLATPALAAWQVNGFQFAGPTARGDTYVPTFDGASDWFIGWQDRQTTLQTGDDVRVQRVTLSGLIPSPWPAGGVLVSGLPTEEFFQDIALDGQGGVFLLWRDDRDFLTNLYVQRINGDGSVAQGWPSSATPVSLAPGIQEPGRVVSDGQGGAYFVWEDYRNTSGNTGQVYAQHLTATGSISPGWPADGLILCSFFGGVGRTVISDGAGGFFAAWRDIRRGFQTPDAIDVYGLHMLADGSRAPGWQANGNLLGPGRIARDLIPDGTGGFYVSSAVEIVDPVFHNVVENEYWIGRWTAAGTPAAGWTANGVRVRGGPGVVTQLIAVPDGAGGVIATWGEGRNAQLDVFAMRLQPDGAAAPGWPANGVVVSDPAINNEFNTAVTPDGSGGAYITWEQSVSSTFSFIQHVGPNGSRAPGWPIGGYQLSNTNNQTNPQLAPDGQGGALVVWSDGSFGHRGIWAQRYQMDGIVATQLSLSATDLHSDRVALTWQGVGAATITARVERCEPSGAWQSLGPAEHDGIDRLRYEDHDVVPGHRYGYRLAWTEGGEALTTAESWLDVPAAAELALDGLQPNPAVGPLHVSFSLPSAAPASLELLDLAGRRVTNRDVGSLGAGRHLLRLDEGTSVAPGVYWLRLRQGVRQLLLRAVVMR